MAETLDLMLVGVYFFFGLYHLLIYGLGPKNKAYLHFGIGTIILAGFLGSRTLAIRSVILDPSAVRGIELLCLFLLFPAFMALFDMLRLGRISRFSLLYSIASIACALVAPFAMQDLFFKLWAWTAPLPAIYLLVFDLAKPFAASWRAKRERDAGMVRVSGAATGMQATGDFGLLSLGAVIVLAALTFDLVNAGLGGDLAISKFGFLAMVFGIAAVLADQHRRAHELAEASAARLEETVGARTAELRSAIDEQSALNARLTNTNLRLQNAMDIASKDMRIAVQVQQGILPAKPPPTTDWEVAFVYHPVSGVSGDFYDFYVEGNRLKGLVVGDVSGHGIASGLVTILARSVFWRNFRGLSDKSLGRVLEQIDAELCKELSSVENYLTCAFLRINEGEVEYVNAGHPEIAYRRAGRARANLLATRNADEYKGPPIGREFIEAPHRAIKFELAPGDSILLYTDCLIESRNDQGQPFGVASLLTAYGRAPEGPATDMLGYVIDEWRFHTESIRPVDDMTAVLIRRLS